jgi:hypothetical protein
MSIIPKELENFTTDVLRAALKVKEEAEKTALYNDIVALEEQLTGKKSLLAQLSGHLDLPQAKRGSKVRRKRDSGLKDTVLEFLKTKGKEGAHVNDIVKHTGKPKANINAFLATTGKKAGIKGKGSRSGIYFLK